MAVNAKFVADFSSFYKEIQKTAPYLKNLGDDVDKVAKKFDTMTKGFSGDKLIRDAHLMVGALVQSGQIANLTEKELLQLGRTVDAASEKMRRMGIDIPPGFKHISDEAETLRKKLADQAAAAKNLSGTHAELLTGVTKLAGAFGIAFGADAVISGVKRMVEGAVEYSDSLKNMSVATGFSIAGLQRLEAVGAEGGVTLQTMASAVNVLQKQLDEPAAQNALKQMGLSFDAIRKLAPEQQLFAIGEAVGSIRDPIDKANTGADLFKGKWSEIASAFTGDAQKIADSTKLMTDAQVNALADAGQAWQNWKREASRSIDGFLGDLVIAAQKANARGGSSLSFLNPISFGIGATQAYYDPGKLPKVGAPGGYIGAGPTAPQMPSQETLNKEAARIEAHIKKVFDAAAKVAVELDAQAEDELVKFANTLVTLRSRTFQGNGQGPADLVDFIQGGRSFRPNTGSGGFAGIGTGPAALGNTTFSTGRGGSLFGGLSTSIPQSILAAIQGGGNVAQAVAGTAGAQIGTNLVGRFGESITKNMGKVFGGAINAVLPGIGALAGPLVGMIGKIFGKSEESSKVSPLRDEFFKMQGGLETLNPKIQALTGNLKEVQAVFDAKTVEQYNAAVAKVSDTLALQESALSTLTETAQRYGFTLEELGPALQRQELDKQAQQLYKDFQVLNSGGLDHVAILTRMSDSANEYVQTAVKMGVEVPNAMRPMLEDMAKQGLLTDAAGNKIDDLEKSGISFALTMSEGFKKLIDSVDKLTRAISLGLGAAIENIPDPDITGRVHWTVDDLPKSDGFSSADFAATGGLVTRNGIQHFANGGRVLAFRPRGSDTVPAMLTPGEMVLTREQQRAILSGGGGAIAIEVPVHIDGREVARAVTRVQQDDYRLRNKVRAS